MSKHLNNLDPEASDAFCGLIRAAAAIFAYQLYLGGMYPHTEHCEEILAHLHDLGHLIDDYDATNFKIMRSKNQKNEPRTLS